MKRQLLTLSLLVHLFSAELAWACMNAMELEGVGKPFFTVSSILFSVLFLGFTLCSVCSPVWFYKLVIVKARSSEKLRRVGAKVFDGFLLILTILLSCACTYFFWIGLRGVLHSEFLSDRLIAWGYLLLCLSVSLFGASQKRELRPRYYELLLFPWTFALVTLTFLSILL